MVWIGNHSIRSFADHFTIESSNGSTGGLDIQRAGCQPGWQAVLLIGFGVCFCIAIYRSYRQNGRVIDTGLLLVCTIGALVTHR